MELGRHLKTIRLEHGYTQEQMAELLNLSRSTYTHYENDTRQPDLNIVARIAEILNVSIDFLTGRSIQRIQAEQLISYLEMQSKSDPDLKLSDLEFENIHEKIEKENYF